MGAIPYLMLTSSRRHADVSHGMRRTGLRGDAEQGQGTDGTDELPETALNILQPGINDRLRRNILFGATGVATLLSLTFWIIGASKDIDSGERVIVPLLTLLFGVLTLLTWRGKLRGAEIGLLALAACVLLERIYFTRHVAKPGLLPVLDTYELLIWFPSVYIFAFLLFDKRHAILFCLTLLGASMAIVHEWAIPGADRIYHADLAEFYIGQVGCIVLIYGFAVLKEQFLDTHRLAVHLRTFAETDFLTGVSNRRAITQALDREINRCERHQGSLAVILLDLDHFKRVNDAFGHDEGDRALRRVSLLMDRSRRQADAFGRWGGEEFLLVTPELDLEGARHAAERLRALIEQSNRSTRATVTASLGVAEYQAGDDAASLVKRADEALMDAKDQGRNQVVTRAA